VTPLVTIHDEIIALAGEKDGGAVALMANMMEQPPVWAADLPVAAEVKSMKRYGK
jgi:hypothetical protein